MYELIPKIGNKMNQVALDELRDRNDIISATPLTTAQLVNLRKYLEATNERMYSLEDQCMHVMKFFEMMEKENIGISEELSSNNFMMYQLKSSLGLSITRCEDSMQSYVNKFGAELKINVQKLKERITDCNQKLLDPMLSDDHSDIEVVVHYLTALSEEIKRVESLAEEYARYQEALAHIVDDYIDLPSLKTDLNTKKTLWDALQTWRVTTTSWLEIPFETIDTFEMEKISQIYFKIAVMSEKKLEDSPVPLLLRSRVEDFKLTLPVIIDLRAENLKERHWNAIHNIVGYKINGVSGFSVGELIEKKIMHFSEEINTVAVEALNEAILEGMLEKVVNLWKRQEFEVSLYKGLNGIFILGSVEEVLQDIDDSLVTLGTVMGSRYVAAIREKVEAWQKRLLLLQETLDEWLSVQKNWMYLENIFAAPDIQRQLPNETKIFEKVDKSWKGLMKTVAANPNCITVGCHKGRKELFVRHSAALDVVQKRLEEYLETKRASFPRFYFLSNDELLEILAQTKDPRAVQPYLRKCFDNLVELTFKGSGILDITQMKSAEGEIVELGKNLKARGSVEEWLTNVEERMKVSLRSFMKVAALEYTTQDKKEWVFLHCAQCVNTIDKVMWSRATEDVLNAIERGSNFEHLQQWLQKNLNWLLSLTSLIRQELTKLQRKVIVVLATINVHARDIIMELIESKIDSASSFLWQKQLRYYWETETDTCFVRQSNAKFMYGYEYEGATGCLVITPLTDRCWMTISGALHLKLGASPAGPAGTGKTESSKDLAKALAVQCIVFNCSDQIDIKMMSMLFKGLSSAGAWTCLDEFNRIDIEVLSVIAQQMLVLRQARLAGNARAMFDGFEIPIRSHHVIITMNPGYAGRTELPDNLKVMFRPVAMMVPDYALIAEIMLFSEGFDTATVLSKKMTKMYKLSSEQLSQQRHYDYGMRAVKSVLVMAGQLKRDNPSLSEDIVLIKACRDSNLPKFLDQDLPLFHGIVKDLFPGVKVPYNDYGSLEQAIKKQIDIMGLQPHPAFIVKAIQLFETQNVRFGVCIVGPTGSGKTTAYQVLQSAMTSLANNGSRGDKYDDVILSTLNPKSVTMGELYGEFNSLSQEWRDGLASTILRTYAAENNSVRKWTVFDGPIDALWIENMNTVLDDNMTLCLANGERIKLRDTMKCLFEVQDLEVASPATVSRLGVMYMTPEHMKWRPYKKSRCVLGAPVNKLAVVFVDDVNMPAVEEYGAQPPIELLRQFVDFSGFYDREKQFWKDVVGSVLVVAGGPPGGGRNELTPRFVRHFNLLCLPPADDDTMTTIFGSILNGFYVTFSQDVKLLSKAIVESSIEIFGEICETMLPTPSKAHYTFNLRDVSKVFQGILQILPSNCKSGQSMSRLWIHEIQRVFHDRLINEEDRKWFRMSVAEKIKRKFKMSCTYEELFDDGRPIIFGDFFKAGESEYCEFQGDIKAAAFVIQNSLEDYNNINMNKMNLVFFADAVDHVCRIARILRQPRGNALLIGIAGSGKQSLTRLSAFILDYLFFQIELTNGYSRAEFNEDIKEQMLLSGVEGKKIAWVFPDSQIVNESFVEDLNNVLNSGDIPNLWESDELDKIVDDMRPIMKREGKIGTRSVCLEQFNLRIRDNLHVVLSFSPVGDAFRNRLRNFPSLINCSTIDWFNSWPEEALRAVANFFMKDVELEIESVRQDVVEMCVTVHTSIEATAEIFYNQLRRKIYTTPKSYLDCIELYKSLLSERRIEVGTSRTRLELGVQKMEETNIMVAEMQVNLTALQPILVQKAIDTEALLKQVAIETVDAEKIAVKVRADEAIVSQQAAVTASIQEDAQKDLDRALPALKSALQALKGLDKKDITEMKSFANPPKAVKTVLEAVCVLLGQKTDWDTAKKVMTDSTFMEKLKKYDKDNIKPNIISKLRNHYLDHPDFQIDTVTKVSKAATSLCMWAHAMIIYDEVAKEVEPKRKKVKEMNKILADANEVLAKKQADLKGVLDRVALLKRTCDDTVAEKKRLADEADITVERLERAEKLTVGLADEFIRWKDGVTKMKAEEKYLIGDAFLAAAGISYYGPFTGTFRKDLMSLWREMLLKTTIPGSEGCTLISAIGKPVEIQQWQINSLPSDWVSTDNAIMCTRGRRWPLMIDPQGQANRWIKKSESQSHMEVTKMNNVNLLRVFESNIRNGTPVLIEDITEFIDPSIDNVLTKNTFQQGSRTLIKLGESEVEYDKSFRFYMTTKMSNPHYVPEICIKVTIINFTVTKSGLEDQLLARVVKAERPDIEHKKNNLVISMADDKQQLADIENKILKLLAESTGEILDNVELINVLASSKTTSTVINERVVESEKTEIEINNLRNKYKPMAVRGLEQELPDVFEGLAASIITDLDTWKFWMESKEPHLHPLPHKWGLPCSLYTHTNSETEEAQTSTTNSDSEVDRENQTGDVTAMQSGLSDFQKLLLVKFLREEKLVSSAMNFVSLNLGKSFATTPVVTMADVYADTNKSTPCIFVLVSGADPTELLLQLAKSKSYGERLNVISLGQGQGPRAEAMIKAAMGTGDWVLLQNCHLAKSWMHRLELVVFELIEHAEDTNDGFRFFLTSFPAVYFPVSVLQNSIKMTNEPPQGLRANILRSFNLMVPEQTWEEFSKPDEKLRWKKLLFGIAFFHAMTQERRKFGPLGWNIRYEFNDSDLQTSIEVLRNFLLECGNVVPWDSLTYVTGEINYGGRVTDDWDRRCLLQLLQKFYDMEILNEEYSFSDSGLYKAPDGDASYDACIWHLKSLPLKDEPEIFGMHENANVASQMQETSEMIGVILSMQPRSTGGGNGEKSDDDIVSEIAIRLETRMPKQLNIRDAGSGTFTVDKEGIADSLGTVLSQELVKFNKLLGAVEKTSIQLQRAIKGLVVMSSDLETMYEDLMFNSIPRLWKSVSYDSLKSLAAYEVDLQNRINFMREWLIHGRPANFPLYLFFFPQGFLTGVLQNHARQYMVPIDALDFSYRMIDNTKVAQRRNGPKVGVFINGLWMEGARLDDVDCPGETYFKQG
eukprot:Stramenopile-MAST_4_protein_545